MAVSYQQDLLATLLPQWHQLLQGWSLDGSLVAAAQDALLLDEEPQALKDLVTQWSAGDFSRIPPIVLLPSSDISGAIGAYAISTGTIYLNQDWLLTATQDQVNTVLTEELGHHLDGLLNAVDTPGDEGEYFANILEGTPPDPILSDLLRTQSDSGILLAQSSMVAVENSATETILTQADAEALFKDQGSTIAIPEGFTAIGDRAFSGLPVTSVTLPSTLTAIGFYAFQFTALESIDLPASLANIADGAFQGCRIGGAVEIPEGVKIIGAAVFAFNPITSITLPSTTTIIGDAALRDTLITNVVVPEGVTLIGTQAFAYTPLESITLPSTLESISDMAFAGTRLSSITVPEGCIFGDPGTTVIIRYRNDGNGVIGEIQSSDTGLFEEGAVLVAPAISGDPDGDANDPNYAYQWFKDGNAITGATSSTFAINATGFGAYAVDITYTDAQGFTTTLTSTDQSVAKIDNGNPVITITGTAIVGSTLTATITTPDPDGNGSFTYQWQSFDGSTWSNIASATASTYQLTSNELAKQVRVEVTSTDAQGYGPIALYNNTTVPVVTPPDTILPTITDISVQGSNVILTFSEKVQATGLNNSTFVVKVGGTGRTVSATNYDSTNQNKVTLTLSGSAPASSTSLQVSYSGTSPNTVKDIAGNSLGTFTNRSADTFLSGASVTSLYADYTNLTLTGTSAINGTGNAKNNTIVGNEAKNTLNGAAGADVLTGAGGTDTFVYTTLANSLLGTPSNYTFDRITDFAIGQDRIDGPKTASASQVLELGAVATLDQAGLQAVLTATKFVANGAASFTYNDNGSTRTFVALNNNVAGFDVTKDAVAEITGYSGLLTNLAIV